MSQFDHDARQFWYGVSYLVDDLATCQVMNNRSARQSIRVMSHDRDAVTPTARDFVTSASKKLFKPELHDRHKNISGV